VIEAATLKDWEEFIDHVGFPAFVAIVLLYVVMHMHRENHDIFRGFTAELARLRELLEVFLKK
jgi:hypothetical protein